MAGVTVYSYGITAKDCDPVDELVKLELLNTVNVPATSVPGAAVGTICAVNSAEAPAER